MSLNTENGLELTLDFDKLKRVVATGAGVIPLVIQDVQSKDVLIVGYVNETALCHTLQTGYATLWSTSRNALWEKGATSGDRLRVLEIRVNCEQNSVLYLVQMEGGGGCHALDAEGRTRRSCFYRRVTTDRLLDWLD